MPDGPATTTTVVSELTPGQMVEKYIALRDKVNEIKKAHTAQLAPYVEAMEWVEGKLAKALDDNGVDSLRADAGTVFRSTETSVSVKDWPVTFEYIQKNQLWDLLEARVSKAATLAVVQETGKPVPGVSISQTQVIRVRRS